MTDKPDSPGTVIKLLRGRYSVRRFQEKPIPDAVIQQILEAGRLSPSGGNEQPWMFGVITDRTLIGQIPEIAGRQDWIARSALVIVLCTRCVEDARGGRDIQCERYPDHAARIRALDRDLYHALNQEEHQTKIAGAHMALAALEHGVGSCWVSRFDVMLLARTLCLPPDMLPAEMLAFGYPAGRGGRSDRKDLSDLVFYNRHSNTRPAG